MIWERTARAEKVFDFSTGCKKEVLTGETEFFSGFLQRHPVFAPSTTPVYSNAAFQILGYALEKITGKSYTDMLHGDIVTPLRLNGTSYAQPKESSRGVIPGTFESSGWNLDVGDEGP